MRTITLKFVVDDDDVEAVNNMLHGALEEDLNTLTPAEWTDRKATAKEIRDARKAEGRD